MNVSKKQYMKFFVTPNSIVYTQWYLGIHDPIGLKYLTRLRIGISHLRAHKFAHIISEIPLNSAVLNCAILPKIALFNSAQMRKFT